MKNILLAKIAMLLFIFSASAQAFVPAPGLWYNPAESGRGFTIDSQDSIMAVVSYAFDKSGPSLWYTSAGTYSESTNTFTATYDGASGGQCLGCTYSGSPKINVNAGGPMKIIFADSEHGVIYFNGGSSPIQHFIYGYANKTGYLYGSWSFSYSIAGLIAGQWIDFTTTYTGTDGTVYASGHEDGVSGTTVLGSYFPSSNAWIVDDYDGSYSTFYLLTSGSPDRLFGHGTIVAGNAAPTTIPYSAIAARIETPSELKGGLSPNGIDAPSEAVLAKMASDIKTYAPALLQQITK